MWALSKTAIREDSKKDKCLNSKPFNPKQIPYISKKALWINCEYCEKHMKVPVEDSNIWNKIKNQIKEKIGESVFDVWFNPIQIKQIKSGKINLEVPDAFFKEWVIEHYSDMIKDSYQKLTGRLADIEININPSLYQTQDKARFSKFKISDEQEEIKGRAQLNPRYTLENFVIGNSNRFAHAASLAVAESPAKTYNPFFIYGGVGLGKTHLLQAICQHIRNNFRQQYKIYYTSSESFTNELIDAIQNRSTARFRQKYRNLDILVIDDIHFIAGKESTQEEFFHTFNALYDSHKQIIISSDKNPKEISHLEERLISRFGWGLITDIQPPDFELRVAILKKKIEKEPVNISDDVIYFIAHTVKTNIRELEGALIRIIAYSLIEERPITINLAKEVLKDFVQEVKKSIDINQILKEVAHSFDISTQDIKSNKRQRNIVLARQIAMYLSRELTNYSLPEIGNSFGGKDHTTVLYANDKIKKEILKNAFLNSKINQIIHAIKH